MGMIRQWSLCCTDQGQVASAHLGLSLGHAAEHLAPWIEHLPWVVAHSTWAALWKASAGVVVR